jgi:hypothetical protein
LSVWREVRANRSRKIVIAGVRHGPSLDLRSNRCARRRRPAREREGRARMAS